MKFKVTTVLIFFLLGSFKTQGMEQSRDEDEQLRISFVDFQRQNFTLEKSAAEILMPTHVAISEHGERIDFSTSNLEIKSLLTKENIELLRDVARNPATMSISVSKITELIKIAEFLQPQDIIFKRLGYLARQHKDFVAPQEWFTSRNTYCIQELLEEPFFDISKIIQKRVRKKNNQEDYKEVPYYYIKAHDEEDRVHINLSNCNIGSLEGLNRLKQTLLENNYIDEHSHVNMLSLNNNGLKALDIDFIGEDFLYLEVLSANENPIEKVTSEKKAPTGQMYFTLRLNKTKLTHLPTLRDTRWGTIITLKKVPLSSRDRYRVRSFWQPWKTIMFSTAISGAAIYGSLRSLAIGLDYYCPQFFSHVETAPLTIKEKVVGVGILGLVSLFYGVCSIPHGFSSHCGYKITEAKSIPQKFIEFGEDVVHSSYNVISLPFRTAQCCLKLCLSTEKN